MRRPNIKVLLHKCFKHVLYTEQTFYTTCSIEKSAIGPGANVHSGVAIIARTYNSGRLFSFRHASQMFETGAHVLPPVPDETAFYLLYLLLLPSSTCTTWLTVPGQQSSKVHFRPSKKIELRIMLRSLVFCKTLVESLSVFRYGLVLKWRTLDN